MRTDCGEDEVSEADRGLGEQREDADVLAGLVMVGLVVCYDPREVLMSWEWRHFGIVRGVLLNREVYVWRACEMRLVLRGCGETWGITLTLATG